MDARSKVPNIRPTSVSAGFRNPNGYQWYNNCLEDTFRSAIKTLGRRIEQFGANSAEIQEWLIGQDAVFANCSGPELIPSSVPSTSHPILKSDRAYQIAAANFYAGHFDIAENLFREIAADHSSPWNQLAAYLAARTLVRKALLDAPSDTIDTKRLGMAESELEKILANDRFKTIHASSKRLLGFVRFRLQPEEQLKELAHDLLNKNSGDTLKQDLWDYTALLDRQHQQPGFDDLTDWVFTFQNDSGFDINHALEKWRETKSLHWFVAVMAKIDVGRTDMTDILKTAATVDRDSPAYSTVLYHRIRILSEMGNKTEARKLLDELFLSTRLRIPISAQNLFRAQRLALARNLDEFLKYAPRTPALITTNEDGEELPDNVKWQSAGSYFDDDAVQVLNKALPVQLLKEASFSKVLPIHLRREIILATWVRAILLENDSLAVELTPEIRRLIPQLSEAMRAYQNAPNPKARHLEAVLIILKHPGMRPFVGVGLSRLTQLSRIDNYRDNWWCSPAVIFGLGSVNASTMFELSWKDVSTKAIPPHNLPSFMSEAQKDVARQEIAKLIQLETAPTYIGKAVIDWAKRNPADPRVPEALHLVVRSTRYGCGNYVSKDAFQLLHKKYPKSEWTKKTPYWF